MIEDEELDAIEIASTQRSRSTVWCRTARSTNASSTPYYVTPNEPVAQDAFAVIREAMRHKGMVALGRLVLVQARARDRASAYDKGLLGATLRYPYEVRDAVGASSQD